LRNELADAKFNLDQTTVRAPASGFVTELALRPGVYVVPIPLRPAMVFVNDEPRDRALAAAFQQNALQRVRAGDEAEVLFKGIPGRVFKAKVRLVIDAIAGGQLQSTGTLVNVGGPLAGDWALALLDIVDAPPPIKSRLVRRVKPPFTPIIFTTYHCCGKSFCACGAGRTTSSSNRFRRN
jgi:multidrug efflux pump subunit AcrA (membrane-fusion protein)